MKEKLRRGVRDTGRTAGKMFLQQAVDDMVIRRY